MSAKGGGTRRGPLALLGLLLLASASIPAARGRSMLGPRCNALEKRLRQAMRDIRKAYGADTIRRSVAVLGGEERYAALLHKLLSGQSVQVAAVGGSITAAAHLPGGVQHGNGTYGATLVSWLNKVFPVARPHTLVRAFLAGGGSSVHRYCIPALFDNLWPTEKLQGWDVAAKSDIFIVESGANDWVLLQRDMEPTRNGRGHEDVDALYRFLLRLPSQPFVILLNFGVHDGEDPYATPFTNTAEPFLDTVAAYYGIPAVSMWRAYFPLLKVQATLPVSAIAASAGTQRKIEEHLGGMRLHAGKLFADRVHPSPAGHFMAGSLLAHQVLSGFRDLLANRMDASEEAQLDVDLPPCPPNTLCHECTGGGGVRALLSRPSVWLNQWLPDSLEAEDEPQPICQLAFAWKVVGIGDEKFPEGLTHNGVEYLEEDSAWKLDRCGPMVPQTKCWMAQKAGMPLHVEVDLGYTGVDCKNVKRLGFMYKIRDASDKEYDRAGADVFVNDEYFASVFVHVLGNTFTHWYINTTAMITTNLCSPMAIKFVPRTSYFDLVAIVAD